MDYIISHQGVEAKKTPASSHRRNDGTIALGVRIGRATFCRGRQCFKYRDTSLNSDDDRYADDAHHP
ncbi:hypothetical protein ACFS07_34145 [Undibacterium arcticum]